MSQAKSQLTAHILIKKTADELAGEFYEQLAHDDEFYRQYPSVKKFIKRESIRFIKIARSILANMLSRPDISEVLKKDIADALFLDRSLPQNQQGPMPTSGLH